MTAWMLPGLVLAASLLSSPASSLPQPQETGPGSPGPAPLPQQDINTLNCFDLVEAAQWKQILGLNTTSASLGVVVTGGGQSLVGCLSRQTVRYLVSVVGDIESQPFLLEDIHTWEGISRDLVTSPPTFPYLIYGGNYRLQVTHCGVTSGPDNLCSEGRDTKTVFSDFINIRASVDAWCQSPAFSGNTSLLSLDTPALSGNTAVFQFSFTPCSSVQAYDTANITLYSTGQSDQCGGQGAMLMDVVSVFRNSRGEAAIMYQSPELSGDAYYCLSVSLSHISCRLVSVETPNYCYLQSEAVWLPAGGGAPLLSFLLPHCTDHFACAWLYIVIGAGATLVLSCVLAICCVRCCDRCGADTESRKGDEVDFSGEVISLARVPVTEKISWAELHREWDTREDKVRGKILLLYSPDTKLFKELQESFKQFLDMACHCDIYDLFDDALFDTIALDPSEWLQEFVNDEDVKILVISSAGKKQNPFNPLQAKISLLLIPKDCIALV